MEQYYRHSLLGNSLLAEVLSGRYLEEDIESMIRLKPAHNINIVMVGKRESDIREAIHNEVKTKKKVVRKHPIYVLQ